MLALLLLGALLRLPGLVLPHSVVLDEVHFGKFATQYCCTHERFFDIHPPHAKLLIAGAAALGGYQGGVDFKHIGLEYPEHVPVFYLRLVPALTGILLPLAVFAMVRRLGASTAAAFAAGFLALWDSAIWVQTRIMALDGLLWLGIVSAVTCLLKAQTLPSMRARLGWLMLCGVAMGMAVGAKFTGLTAGAIVFALLLSELLAWRTFTAVTVFFRQCVWIGLPFLLTYLAGWALHFALLTNPGGGDNFYQPTGEFFRDLARLHEVMLSANYHLTAAHPDASAWWTWPCMVVPVFYWTQTDRVIYLMGNPVVWWGTTAVGLTALMIWLLQPLTRLRLPETPSLRCRDPGSPDSDPTHGLAAGAIAAKSAPPMFWVPILGFLVAYLPNVGIPRSLFLYHYIPALLFALAFVVLWLERCGWTAPDQPLRRQPGRYWGVLLSAVAGFLLMLPLTGGIAGFGGWREFLFRLFPTWP